MTSRARRLVTLASLVILVACGPTSGPGASASAPPTAPGSTGSGAPVSQDPSPSPSEPPEPLRIGLVTAIASGETVARDAATAQAVGNAAADLDVDHEVIETEEDADFAPNIQAFIDHGFRIVVTVGEAAGPATIAAARTAPDTWFIGVDQRGCVTPDGEADPEDQCEGDVASLVPNYRALSFAEEQAAYLAGIVGARVSRRAVLAVVGGSSVPWVVRSWRGFENGARSVDPDADVRYLELASDGSGFGDPAFGRVAGDQLVTEGADVLFQVAGESGQGVIEAACAAGITAIGSVVDQARALPDLPCIVTSAELRHGDVVTAAVIAAATGAFVPGVLRSGLAQEPPGAGLSPITGVELSPDDLAILGAAARALATGAVDACAPVACTVSGAADG